MLYGNSTFSAVTLKVLNATIQNLRFGIPLTNLTAGLGKRMLFKLLVPYSSYKRLLVISLSGGSGNANLFVRRTYLPTTSDYDWFLREDSNEEEVYINYYRYSSTLHFILSKIKVTIFIELINISLSNQRDMHLVKLVPGLRGVCCYFTFNMIPTFDTCLTKWDFTFRFFF